MQIRDKTRKEPELCFTSIYHFVTDEGNLYASYRDLEPGKAPGIDGVTKEGYGKDLEKNITDLAQLAAAVKRLSSLGSVSMMLSPGCGGHRFESCTISIRSGDLSDRRTAEEPDAGKSTCPVPRGAGRQLSLRRREHPAYSTRP